MLKLKSMGEESIVTVGMAIRIQNIRTEKVFKVHVGLIRGTEMAVFEDDAIYVFNTQNRIDDSGLFQLADKATLTYM